MIATRLVPTDKALPFLATVLDEHAMRNVFERLLRDRHGCSVEVTACKIQRLKYRPQRNCIIGYGLKLRDAQGEREQRLCAGVYAPVDAMERYDKALGEATIATPHFAPVTFIRSLNMVVWAFPNERKLNALALLMDATQLREKLLPEVVRERWGEGWEIVDLSHTISNYFPEHSCCVRVTLALNHSRSGTRHTWEIFGKNRYDHAGMETKRHMTELWRGVHSDVSYARPIVYQAEHRMLWQERVPGVTLLSLLVSGAVDNALCARVARAIAALHRTSVFSPRHVTLSDIVDRLITAKKIVAEAHPQCSATLQPIVQTLVNGAGVLNLDYEGAWHGDLHSNNILVSPEHIYLVDMDRVSVGPPLAEIGSFLAELIYHACLRGEPLEAVRPTLIAVIDAYRRRASWPVPEQDVAWFTAGALIYERALRCVTSLKVLRADAVDNLMAAAARIASGDLFIGGAELKSTPTGNLVHAT